MHGSSVKNAIGLTYYSDVLCIWAYISQARVDEAIANYPQQLQLDYRFCSVFGDVPHKMQSAWADRGGFEAYAEHVQQVADDYEHIRVHPGCWLRCRPVSSTPAHLVLKAAQRVSPARCGEVLHAVRAAFFEHGLDISQRQVLNGVIESCELPLAAVNEVIDSGIAFADLEADRRDQQALMIQGSPTILLNDGRQKLYGNVGYRVIEANINEMLNTQRSGAASWC